MQGPFTLDGKKFHQIRCNNAGCKRDQEIVNDTNAKLKETVRRTEVFEEENKKFNNAIHLVASNYSELKPK